ncbi:MAG: prepilin-type N-terminal cleavage/methylation domain-containing protein, partial [Acidobacteria bacterium]|nr:prepilin-type N-terminal cleavage/methylation domain-containing protein [Acidobacteriota bacterium]
MRNFKDQKGFSLIELLVVVVIVGVVAALAVPAYQRGILAAEIRSVHATMKVMSSSQAMFFSQNQRFARLSELNSINANQLGTISGDRMFRHNFTFEMTPLAPTDAELRESYAIGAFRDAAGLTWRFEMTNTGLQRVLPTADEY